MKQATSPFSHGPLLGARHPGGRRTGAPSRGAFTLLELLLVIGIIALLTGLIAGGIGTLRAFRLEQAAQTIRGELTLARQTALSRNRPVEVRFFRYVDPTVPGEQAPGKFRAVQSFITEEDGTITPLRNLQKLPVSIILNANPEFSSVLDPAKRSVRSGSTPLAAIGATYDYASVSLRPDGSTDLPATANGVPLQWFLTLHEDRQVGNGSPSTLPPNFWTLQINPVTGTLRSHRP